MALTDLDSVTKRLINQEAGGCLSRFFCSRTGGTSVATINCGNISAQRLPNTFTIPSVSGYTGWELDANMFSDDAGGYLAALEFELGTLAVSTNTFSAGAHASTPASDTRVNGTSYTARQTGSMIPMLVVTSGLTGTTPTITTTYVNEDGTGSRSSALIIPSTTIVNSAFCMAPHLNSGDTGMQDVTNMSKSAGTAGTLAVKALLPVKWIANSVAGGAIGGMSAMHQPFAPVIALPGDTLAFYAFGVTGAKEVIAEIFGRPI